jgi:hypothetical protein
MKRVIAISGRCRGPYTVKNRSAVQRIAGAFLQMLEAISSAARLLAA